MFRPGLRPGQAARQQRLLLQALISCTGTQPSRLARCGGRAPSLVTAAVGRSQKFAKTTCVWDLRLQAANAFCAVRPPGHHAGPTGVVTCANDPHGSHGFCLLNNIAIAAAYAVNVYRHQGVPLVTWLNLAAPACVQVFQSCRQMSSPIALPSHDISFAGLVCCRESITAHRHCDGTLNSIPVG